MRKTSHPTLIALAAFLAAAPCARAETYVSRLDGAPKDACIAIVVDGGDVVIYACAADQEFNERYAQWIRGKIQNNAFLGAKEGCKVRLAFSKDVVEGKLYFTGVSPFIFRAYRSKADSAAGLYRIELSERLLVGWIVDEGNGVAGAVRDTKTNKAATLTAKQLPPPSAKTTPKQLEALIQKGLSVRLKGVDQDPADAVEVGPFGVTVDPTTILRPEQVRYPYKLPRGTPGK